MEDYNNTKVKEFDILIIGAGLVGLATAYQLKKKFPHKSLLIIEKENAICKHQSGNNSGVIHSGIYYKPGSLKAKNCIDGYTELLEFCDSNDVDYDICGKIIVASDEMELQPLDNIYSRGLANNLQGLKKLKGEELKEYEPHVAGIAGVHVPQTGIVDFIGMGNKLLNLILELGGKIIYNSKLLNFKEHKGVYIAETTQGDFCGKKIISCAGLQSDRVAHMNSELNDLRIIPFRGEYYKLKKNKEFLVRNLIYPVPNPEFPFLGVHFTRMIGGGIEAGPNAVLAFKREGYKLTDFSIRDTIDTLSWPGFWKIALKYGKIGAMEMYRSISKESFTRSLQKLVPEINASDLESGGAGVRAQACDAQGNLIDDFNFIKTPNLIHVRNAPSPAATSCLSIGENISNYIQF